MNKTSEHQVYFDQQYENGSIAAEKAFGRPQLFETELSEVHQNAVEKFSVKVPSQPDNTVDEKKSLREKLIQLKEDKLKIQKTLRISEALFETLKSKIPKPEPVVVPRAKPKKKLKLPKITLSGLVTCFLGCFVYLFYFSIVHCAFIDNFAANLSEATSVKDIALNSVFSTEAFHKTLNAGGFALIFNLVAPFYFIALALLLHRYLEKKDSRKNYSIAAVMFLFTLGIDGVFAWQIVKDVYETKFSMGLVDAPWKFSQLFSLVEFYIILGCSTAALMLFGLSLKTDKKYVVENPEPAPNPIEEKKKFLQEKEIQENKLRQAEIDMKLHFKTLADIETAITETQQALQSYKPAPEPVIRYEPRLVARALNMFLLGWQYRCTAFKGSDEKIAAAKTVYESYFSKNPLEKGKADSKNEVSKKLTVHSALFALFFSLSSIFVTAPAKVSADSVESNLNLTIALDLSDRIGRSIASEQAQRDLSILQELIASFEKRQKQKFWRFSKDRLQVLVVPQPDGGYRLSSMGPMNIDMAYLNAEGNGRILWQKKKPLLIEALKNLYEQAAVGPKKGADLWMFWKTYQAELTAGEEEQLVFENRVVVLSDGYLFFDKSISAKRPKGSYFSTSQFKHIREIPEGLLNSSKKKIKPFALQTHPALDLSTLHIWFLEVTPVKPHIYVQEFDNLKAIWSQFFTNMGVKQFSFNESKPQVSQIKPLIKQIIY